MPANLTPEFLSAEQRYRQSRTPQEKIQALEDMLRAIPKHKGTDHMQADIKKRLSQAKKDSKKKSVRAVHSKYVKPEGIGQVFLVGPANAGKSALLNCLTNAKPTVAEFPFTTQNYLPGMMRYEDVWIQLVDMPPVSAMAPIPWIPSVVRYGDGAVLMLSLASDDLLEEVEEVIGILREGKVILARKGEPVGYLEKGAVGLKTILVCTHCLDPDAGDRLELLGDLLGDAYPVYTVDTEAADTLVVLRKTVYDMLGVLRVYGKQPAKPPDLKEPFVVKRGCTVEKLAGKIHKDIRSRFDYARIWSAGQVYDGQRVARDYVLQEGDVVEMHM